MSFEIKKNIMLKGIGCEICFFFCFFSILGSGGAIIGLLQDESKFEEMRDELQRFMGSVVVDVIPNEF